MHRDALALLVGLALWATPQSASAGPALQWEAEHVLLSPAVGATDAEGTFRFTNRSNATVHVVEARSSCGCTVAAPAKDVFQAGESGDIRARYHIGEREGRQSVTIWVTTDEAGMRPYELTLEVEILVPVRVLPRFLMWKVGEDPAPKLFLPVLRDGWSFKEAVADSDAFAVEVVPRDDGSIQVRVTPRDTWSTRQGTIRFKVALGEQPPIECVVWARVL